LTTFSFIIVTEKYPNGILFKWSGQQLPHLDA